MNKEKLAQVPDDEIDLLDLLIKVIQIIKKRFILLVLFLVIGGGLGSVGYFYFKPVYTTKMILDTQIIEYADVANLLETTKYLIDENSEQELMKKFNVSKKVVEGLKSLEAINIVEKEVGRTDKEAIKDNRLIIEAKVTDNNIIGQLQEGILYYLENNQFVKERIKDNKRNLRLFLAKVRSERLQIDSLKKSIESLIATNKEGNIHLTTDIGGLYQKSVTLYDKELKTATELKFADRIQVLEGFTKFEKPTSFDLKKSIIAGLGASFFFWIFVVIILEIRVVMRKILKDKNNI